ncbi:MAG: L-threonylcarbamoyladenylate synthase [Patescibacteria group bacterium]|nr:L-threonylcarbamoyladenylate synthase [Patescibacteria group bacterium]
METIRISAPDGVSGAAKKAADVIRAGGVVLYPTDTLYGLGADAFSDDAVGKVYAIKGREESKPIHAIVADMAMAEEYGDISHITRQLASRLPRGKLTFIVNKKEGLDAGICRGIPTFGFRIPDNAFCAALLEALGTPVTATSANKSVEAPERTVAAILKQLSGDQPEPDSYASVLQNTSIAKIDLAIDAGELPESQSSTVVDLSSPKNPVILREGAVEAASVWNAIRAGY